MRISTSDLQWEQQALCWIEHDVVASFERQKAVQHARQARSVAVSRTRSLFVKAQIPQQKRFLWHSKSVTPAYHGDRLYLQAPIGANKNLLRESRVQTSDLL
jgi:hypothetical protein